MLRFTVPTPAPVPTSQVDDALVTPGVWGFVITFLLVVAVVLLIIDMTRRIRRVTHRAQVREQLELEQLAAEAAALADEPRKPEKSDKPTKPGTPTKPGKPATPDSAG